MSVILFASLELELFFEGFGFTSSVEEEVVYTTTPPVFEFSDVISFNDVPASTMVWIPDQLNDEVRFDSKHPETPDYSFWRTRSKTVITINPDRPDDYWNGDWGWVYYFDGHGSLPYGLGSYGGDTDFIEGDGYFLKSEFLIIDSTTTTLTLYEALPYEVPQETVIKLVKDNFKKDSFQYKRKSEGEKINTLHLDYILRDNGIYRTDTLDLKDEYLIEKIGGVVEQSFEMKGIKRNSQARRMITFLSDFNIYVNWECSFDTDIIGTLLCVGSIIGVTSEEMGWSGKLFRVATTEELETFEFKLNLVEYIPSIYGDNYIEPADSDFFGGIDIFEFPDDVINLSAIEDTYTNKIWLGFSKPIENNNFWIGAIIYHYNPDTSLWYKLGTATVNTFTGALDSAITSTQTTIPFSFDESYDTSKLTSSGIIWLEEEIIYYGRIDDINYQFLDCIRGYYDTEAVSHSSGTCVLFKNSLYYYEYDVKYDVGKTHSFKAVSVTSFGIMSTSTDADLPTVDIFINGKYDDIYPVSLLSAISI